MRAIFHRLLLMLLLLTLPLQGLAAVTMPGCASHLPVAVASDMAGCHEVPQTGSPPAAHDCAQCDACVAAAPLLIPDVLPLLPLPTANRVALPPVAGFSGFIPNPPERPPRRCLA